MLKFWKNYEKIMLFSFFLQKNYEKLCYFPQKNMIFRKLLRKNMISRRPVLRNDTFPIHQQTNKILQYNRLYKIHRQVGRLIRQYHTLWSPNERRWGSK